MPLKQVLVEAIEKATGEKIASLQEIPIDVRRAKAELQSGKTMTFKNSFPFLGRGSILRKKEILSHAEVEAELDKALR